MSQKGTDTYLVSINYMGQDVQVYTEDLDTANLLLNDQQAAFQFLNQFYPENYPIPGGSKESSCQYANPDISFSCSTEGIYSVPTRELSSEEIWCKKKPTEIDLAATELFLSLREEYKAKFDDSKTSKTSIWKSLATKMVNENYNLGKDPIEKCRQKWANLQKKYFNHIKHMKTTGVEKKDSPPYFDILHGILGNKDKTNPKMLIDSEQIIMEKQPTAEAPVEKENVQMQGDESDKKHREY